LMGEYLYICENWGLWIDVCWFIAINGGFFCRFFEKGTINLSHWWSGLIHEILCQRNLVYIYNILQICMSGNHSPICIFIYIYTLSLFCNTRMCSTWYLPNIRGGNLHREILTMEELPPLLDIKLPESYLYHPKRCSTNMWRW
jgi:hypothetical protein